LGPKVSDEFTVPLCAIHHHQNHPRRAMRLDGWQQHRINPLQVAQRLLPKQSSKFSLLKRGASIEVAKEDQQMLYSLLSGA
jgi:hypothetical protein